MVQAFVIHSFQLLHFLTMPPKKPLNANAYPFIQRYLASEDEHTKVQSIELRLHHTYFSI